MKASAIVNSYLTSAKNTASRVDASSTIRDIDFAKFIIAELQGDLTVEADEHNLLTEYYNQLDKK